MSRKDYEDGYRDAEFDASIRRRYEEIGRANDSGASGTPGCAPGILGYIILLGAPCILLQMYSVTFTTWLKAWWASW